MNLDDLKFKVITKDGSVNYLTLRNLMDIPKDTIESVHYQVANFKEVEVYSNDTITLNVADIPSTDGFFGSNVGRLVLERGYDTIELKCYELDNTREKITPLNYEVSFLKEGNYITEAEYYGFGLEGEELKEYEEGLDKDAYEVYLFTEVRTEDRFIRYLLSKGAKLKE